MINSRVSDTDESPPDLSDVQLQLIPNAPIADLSPQNYSFGSVVDGYDANPTYYVNEVVSVKFVSANPRNNLRVQDTYLTVESVVKLGKNKVILTDSDWETRFHWLGGLDDPLGVTFS